MKIIRLFKTMLPEFWAIYSAQYLLYTFLLGFATPDLFIVNRVECMTVLPTKDIHITFGVVEYAEM